jgi:hypothetical protein
MGKIQVCKFCNVRATAAHLNGLRHHAQSKRFSAAAEGFRQAATGEANRLARVLDALGISWRSVPTYVPGGPRQSQKLCWNLWAPDWVSDLTFQKLSQFEKEASLAEALKNVLERRAK